MHTLQVHVEHTEIAAQYDPTIVHTYHKAVNDSHQKHLSSLCKLAVPCITSYPILAG